MYSLNVSGEKIDDDRRTAAAAAVVLAVCSEAAAAAHSTMDNVCSSRCGAPAWIDDSVAVTLERRIF